MVFWWLEFGGFLSGDDVGNGASRPEKSLSHLGLCFSLSVSEGAGWEAFTMCELC